MICLVGMRYKDRGSCWCSNTFGRIYVDCGDALLLDLRGFHKS